MDNLLRIIKQQRLQLTIPGIFDLAGIHGIDISSINFIPEIEVQPSQPIIIDAHCQLIKNVPYRTLNIFINLHKIESLKALVLFCEQTEMFYTSTLFQFIQKLLSNYLLQKYVYLPQKLKKWHKTLPLINSLVKQQHEIYGAINFDHLQTLSVTENSKVKRKPHPILTTGPKNQLSRLKQNNIDDNNNYYLKSDRKFNHHGSKKTKLPIALGGNIIDQSLRVVAIINNYPYAKPHTSILENKYVLLQPYQNDYITINQSRFGSIISCINSQNTFDYFENKKFLTPNQVYETIDMKNSISSAFDRHIDING